MAEPIVLQGEQILWADFALRYSGYPCGPDDDDDQYVGPNRRVSDNSCDQLAAICWRGVPAEDYGIMDMARPHMWRPLETKDGAIVMDPVRVSVGRDSAQYILRSVYEILRNEPLDRRPEGLRALATLGPRKFIKMRKSEEHQGTSRQSLYDLAKYITAQLTELGDDPARAITSE